MGLGGTLSAVHYRAPKVHKARSIRIPGLGRVIITKDRGTAPILGRDQFQSHLFALHLDGDGKIKGGYDCGSGNVQSNFVVGLAQDQLGTSTNHAAPLFANSGKYMYSGTGSTVNTYDFQLATTAGPASGTITPTLGVTANGTAGTDATLQYVGTIAYTSTLAIAEWGLFGTNVQGSQFTSTTNVPTATGTSSSTWGSALSTNAQAGSVVYASASSVAGFITANTTGTSGTITISPGWYKLASSGGSGSTPATNANLQIYPLMTDHKTFSTINVVNGDSIQFTYTLQIVSGG